MPHSHFCHCTRRSGHFFLFMWFDVDAAEVSDADRMMLFCHICGDFGPACPAGRAPPSFALRPCSMPCRPLACLSTWRVVVLGPTEHCEQWLGCCIFILQCLAPRPVPCFVYNKTGTFATVLPHVTATVMPQALQTGDGGLVNVPRRFYSIFKDPFRALSFSTKPLRFPV